MKGWSPAVCRLTRWIAVAFLAGAAGCGGKGLRVGRDAAGPGNAGTSDAVTGADLATGNADSSSEAMYAGVVLAMLTEDEAATSYVARAVFAKGPRPAIGGCPDCCCGIPERGLPIPVKPPDAGKITIAAGGNGTALATLVPEAFSGGSGIYHGMSDLGWSWFRPLGDYALVDSQPWTPGDSLRVLAAGNEVESFSGVLQAGPSLAGVTPPIGSSPIAIDRSEPFELSWTPGGEGNATVLLSVPYSGGICYCDAPDSAGRLVVPANLLGLLPVGQNARIKLARLTISTVASGNATVDLVGAVVQAGPLSIE